MGVRAQSASAGCLWTPPDLGQALILYRQRRTNSSLLSMWTDVVKIRHFSRMLMFISLNSKRYFTMSQW